MSDVIVDPGGESDDVAVKSDEVVPGVKAEEVSVLGPPVSTDNAGVEAGCQCEACQTDGPHMSDCAVHNEPAYPNGPCSCGGTNRDDPDEPRDPRRSRLVDPAENVTNRTSAFGGRVWRTFTLGRQGEWWETVEGPGGTMAHRSVANSKYGPYPFGGYWVDMDGTRHECPDLPEGSDYGECIETVYGPEVFAELQERIAARR